VTPAHIEENIRFTKFEGGKLSEEDIKQIDSLNCNQRYVQPKFYKFPETEEDVTPISSLATRDFIEKEEEEFHF
jgi:diketogulonate reductase-like aldo/keto reductase